MLRTVIRTSKSKTLSALNPFSIVARFESSPRFTVTRCSLSTVAKSTTDTVAPDSTPAEKVDVADKTKIDNQSVQDAKPVNLWRSVVDSKTKITYYTHKRTMKTVWRDPNSSVKASWRNRFLAGGIDIGVSISCAVATNITLLLELDDIPVAGAGAMIAFAMSFMCRDILADKGTRSWGKRFMRLEVVREADGSFPGRFPNVMRNFYFSTFNVSAYAFPFIHVLYLIDAVGGAMNEHGRRLCDLACGTVVVKELPLRAERLQARTDIQAAIESQDIWLSDLPQESFYDRVWYDMRARNKLHAFQYRKK